MPVKVDIDRLVAAASPEKFKSFETEIESSIVREHDERRRKAEESKRAREKKAKKKRMKAASSAS